MITVVVDRDSVAMGDDVEEHVQRWEMPDDTRLGDVLARAITDGYLASVGGSVGWTLEGAGYAVKYRADGSIALESVSKHLVVASIQIDYDRKVTVSQLPGWLLADELRRREIFLHDGVYAFNFRYASGGRPLAWNEFEDWLKPFRR